MRNVKKNFFSLCQRVKKWRVPKHPVICRASITLADRIVFFLRLTRTKKFSSDQNREMAFFVHIPRAVTTVVFSYLTLRDTSRCRPPVRTFTRCPARALHRPCAWILRRHANRWARKGSDRRRFCVSVRRNWCGAVVVNRIGASNLYRHCSFIKNFPRLESLVYDMWVDTGHAPLRQDYYCDDLRAILAIATTSSSIPQIASPTATGDQNTRSESKCPRYIQAT
jgi:hypothetical protein